jgi:hypothetical protein
VARAFVVKTLMALGLNTEAQRPAPGRPPSRRVLGIEHADKPENRPTRVTADGRLSDC